MKKVIFIYKIAPFDLMRWGKTGFYKVLNQTYFKKYNNQIEILEADLSFIKGGIKAKIITYR